MHLQCPHCQRPITPGALSCQGCGVSLLQEATPGSAEPTCAIHPNRVSLASCDRCGTFACAECLHQNSRGEVVCQRCHELEPDVLLPWDKREELGTFTALWKTIHTVMLHPEALYTVRPEGSASSSLLFSLLCSLPSGFMTGLTYMGIFSFMPAMLPAEARSSGDLPTWIGPLMFVLCLFLVPLFSVASTVILSGLDHLVMKLGGVTRGYGVTLRAHSLSQAPWVLGLIPFCGMYSAMPWALVARAFAYRGLHRTTWGVALTGTLIVPVLSCCMCGGFYALMFSMMRNNF
ncbi:YIP1 family protein [Archangium lansingense]|uniref:YIP1 family protein n=1 Tax=Archangium lansingense TaxID=2995310 RepID=A0ABT4AJV1_9BACT|nr:YIP1 family protein [Archangium lansinium]MCY1081953.1 YIP1 family protein [Archangium lansinium]